MATLVAVDHPEPADEGLADPGFTPPLDAADPRFVGATPDETPPEPRRELVRNAGPGSAEGASRAERRMRAVLPIVFFGGLAAVVLIFLLGLQPGPQSTTVGPEGAVRAAIAQRPKRVCLNDNNPCAWLRVVDGEVMAFNTNGPLPQEFGRDGVSWCPSSDWFGANGTGSRYDQQGRIARGPAPRGLDRFGVRVDERGLLIVNWLELTAGRRAFEVTEVTPPTGPHCDTIPFDREADLELP